MLYVNDFGCQYHAGEDARCTCQMFRVEKDETPPSHPRVFPLPIGPDETEIEARRRYRGQDHSEQDKIEAAHAAANAATDRAFEEWDGKGKEAFRPWEV